MLWSTEGRRVGLEEVPFDGVHEWEGAVVKMKVLNLPKEVEEFCEAEALLDAVLVDPPVTCTEAEHVAQLNALEPY